MNSTSGHDALRDQLPGAVLGLLDSSESTQVLEHARICESCAELLRDYEEVVAGLSLLAPSKPMDAKRFARTRASLLARSRAEASVPSRARKAADRWMGWGVAAALAGVLLLHHGVHRPLDLGWIVAGILMLALVAVGAYAQLQRNRAAALRRRLLSVERNSHGSDGGGGTDVDATGLPAHL